MQAPPPPPPGTWPITSRSHSCKSFIPGVAEDKIKIKHRYIPHLVENTKGQRQGHVEVNQNESESKFNDVSNSSENLRHRHHQDEKPATESLNHLKFAAINSEPNNQNAASGRWVFLNLLNLKALFLGALKTLPWYAIILAFLAVPIDAIFKTKFVSTAYIFGGVGL